MARAWIQDRWLRGTEKTLADGTVVRIDPPAGAKRSLAMNIDHPERANVPDEFRTSEFGRGRRWMVFWQADEGRKRRSFKDYQSAEAFRASIEDDIRSGKYVNPKDLERTFGDVADLWRQTLTGTIKGATESRYVRELRVWVLPRWGKVPLGRITTGSIQTWVAQLAEGKAPYAGRRGTPRPLAPKSIRSIVTIVMGAVLKFAVESGWMQHNPMGKVKMPRMTVAQPRVYLVPAEIKAIADGMSEADATVVYVLAYTGIRIGEAFALRCGDVDFDARTLAITKTQSVDREGHITETLPKGNRSRRVPIPSSLMPRLGELVRECDDGGYLFRAPRGGANNTQNWRVRTWFPALRAAGMDEIPGLVIHSLRHTYASIAIKSGADVKTVQKVMGHASAAETLDTYADLWPDRTGDVAAAVDRDIIM
ncbi:site-specific integrase [Bifidobacterium sp. SO4]|uniref:tyrosine-type recombinase/integrase n=1 Tax=Bifidobacterium sp. SO4 TaxID=2809030 RepID=UPI001BDD9E75|nr:site-specific integrase [Bifidobacterium sp. SO4]MBT1171012.1 site-specific integrase [Bifidobacterium sp. SO4]